MDGMDGWMDGWGERKKYAVVERIGCCHGHKSTAIPSPDEGLWFGEMIRC